MNVYDFDKTIYAGDSSIDFFIFGLKKSPKKVFSIPNLLYKFFLLKIGKITKKEFKELFFSIIIKNRNIEHAVAEFWSKKRYKIMTWYLLMKKNDDVIISASPEFLLKTITTELGVNLIATIMDETGQIIGDNCYGSAKVVRFNQQFSNSQIDAFYSDSLSDLPMAKLAQKAFLVKRETIKEWKI